MAAEPLSDSERRQIDRMSAFAKAGNHYAILGLPPGADQTTIQAAYYQLSREWHPDRHFRRELGEYKAKLELVIDNITKAYKVLSDSDRRRRFDRDNKDLLAVAAAEDQARQDRSKPADAPQRKRKKRRLSPEERAARERARERMARKKMDPRTRAIQKLREQARGRNSRAKRYFEQGQADYQAGNIAKAVSSLHLAVQFDEGNAEYRALYELARSEASSSASVQFMQAGESAESFQNFKEAIYNYQRACDQEPADGLPYFRLATLVLRVENDQRKALKLLRTASSKSPKNVEIRLSLADLYLALGMGLNAGREYQTVLRIDKTNSRAKTGLRNVR